MGNSLSPCFLTNPNPTIKLVFWGGVTQLLHGTQSAGVVLFNYPDHIICQADSFYIGRPIPTLSIEDKLLSGQTYFVLPVDCFPGENLTTASLASLSSSKKKPAMVSAEQFPFEYVKCRDGRMLIRVLPEFIIRVISEVEEDGGGDKEGEVGLLCSTPELRKHYAQLVGARDRSWSPKLETITEKNKLRLSPIRLLSPVRLLALEWRSDD